MAISSMALQMNIGKTNLYEVLSLDISKNKVGFDEIKKAYRFKALKFHPDACDDPSKREELTRRFIEIKIAYDTLSDPISREMYDFELGLGGDSCRGRRSYGMGEERGFSREVWQRQLNGLKKRSTMRMEKKKIHI